MTASVLKSPAHIRARTQAAEIAREWDDAALAKALLDHADSIEGDGRAHAPQIMREAAKRLANSKR